MSYFASGSTCFIVLFPAFSLITFETQAQQLATRTVVFLGESATNSDTTFDRYLSWLQINESGQVAFIARDKNPSFPSISGESLWSEGDGQLKIIAETWSTPVGFNSEVIYERIDFASLMNSGDIAFEATLQNSDPFSNAPINNHNDSGIWSHIDGITQLVTREGNTAPGTNPGVVHSGGFFFSFNDSGHLVIASGLRDSVNNVIDGSGVWINQSGSFEPIAITDDNAPGLPGEIPGGSGSGRFDRVGGGNFVANDDVLIGGTVNGVGGVSGSPYGLWLLEGESLRLLVREKMSAPGTPDGVVLSGFRYIDWNYSGSIVISSGLEGPGIGSQLSNDSGLWLHDGTTLSNLALEGMNAPGTSQQFGALNFSKVFMNNSGEIAVMTKLTGVGVDSTDDDSLWKFTSSSQTLLVREGDEAVGTDPDVYFSGFSNLTSPSQASNILMMNDLGHIIFKSFLRGEGVTSSNDEAIWVVMPDLSLSLVVREGDLFDVNDDPTMQDERIISGIFTYKEGSGPSTAFNDNGELALALRFTDGSNGIFVIQVPTHDILTGDTNLDGEVDQEDLNILLNHWGSAVATGTFGDWSRNGSVGIDDLTITIRNWTGSTTPQYNIPEPGTASALALVSIAILRRSRRNF